MLCTPLNFFSYFPTLNLIGDLDHARMTTIFYANQTQSRGNCRNFQWSTRISKKKKKILWICQDKLCKKLKVLTTITWPGELLRGPSRQSMYLLGILLRRKCDQIKKKSNKIFSSSCCVMSNEKGLAKLSSTKYLIFHPDRMVIFFYNYDKITLTRIISLISLMTRRLRPPNVSLALKWVNQIRSHNVSILY